MTTYYSFTATGTTGDDTFIVSNQMSWNSFRNKTVNGSTGYDVFQINDDPGYLSGSKLSVANGTVTISTASAKVYLTNFEKITYNGTTSWEATPVTTNHAPTVTNPIADQTAKTSAAFAFTVPSNSFTDPDGNLLTYSATQGNGAALPSWLSFNPSTHAFSGTPTTAGTVSVKVTASDGSLTATDTFNITVTAAVVTPGDGNDTVTGTASADSLNGYAGNDTLTGLAGNDTLDGGTGADSMVGGLGNDTYIVDNTGDVVIELANQGTDLVKSSISFTLPDNVENLTLTESTNINGTGNALANVITGNSGNNVLDGGVGADTLIGGDGSDTIIGGTGKDVLTGGAGSDVFRFDIAFSNSDFDTITDFVSGTDKISLKAALVIALGSEVSTTEFVAGTKASSADQHLIYNKSTGYLSYDADGSGAGAAIIIALIGTTSHPTLVYTDFVIA